MNPKVASSFTIVLTLALMLSANPAMIMSSNIFASPSDGGNSSDGGSSFRWRYIVHQMEVVVHQMEVVVHQMEVVVHQMEVVVHQMEVVVQMEMMAHQKMNSQK